jgi:hypothetical protein
VDAVSGDTLLHIAVRGKDTALMMYLLSLLGDNFNYNACKNKKMEHPLLLALQQRQKNVVGMDEVITKMMQPMVEFLVSAVHFSITPWVLLQAQKSNFLEHSSFL